jgi:hypothetical protein
VDATHYDFQLRQRLTSSGLNTQEGWTARMSPELLRRLVSADSGNVSGVFDGLKVSVQPATMNVQISGGLALLYDATQVAPNSAHRWIEVLDGTPLTATLDVGGASPRWDVIEIAPGNVDGAGEVLDFYNSNTGAFVPAVAAPLKVCTPTVTVRKGTESAAPKFPAGVAGRIPLAYVYVAAGAIVLNVDRVCFCRPMLRPRGYDGAPNFQAKAHGGGWRRLLSGLTGNLAADMMGTFPNGAEFYLQSGSSGYDLSASGNFDGGGLPIANGTVYLYAAPPPYPSGYDAILAPREIFIVDDTVMGACYVNGAYGAIIVATLIAPERSQIGTPVTAGTCDIVDGLFGTVSIDHADMVYIGCSYFQLAGGFLYAQRAQGALGSSLGVAGIDIDALLPIAADTAVSLAANITGDSVYRLPAHVDRVHLIGYHNLDVQGDITIFFRDGFSTSTAHVKSWTQYRSNTMADLEYGCTLWVTMYTGLQLLTINYADGNGLTTQNKLRVSEWEDSVLALR